MSDIERCIISVLNKGDILLMVSPFVTCRTPVMGPHILQAVAQEQGYKVDVLHLNLLLASLMGVDDYERICFGQPFRMLGERLFARAAFGLPPLGRNIELCSDPVKSVFGDETEESFDTFEYKYYPSKEFDRQTLFVLEKTCYALVEEVSHTISRLHYKIVGCSSNWEQNNCSIALLNRIKEYQPDVLTLMGGSNCEGEMAEGMASLSDSIDYIFSGESESTFTEFLDDFSHGRVPHRRIIEGQPVENLDVIPLPDYQDYFIQAQCFFPEDPLKGISMCCETSRGCWYNQCTFCGMNGKRGRFRQKSAKKAFGELNRLNAGGQGRQILIVDKVMPTSYQEELFPLLHEIEEMAPIGCEQRPNLNWDELVSIKKAGIHLMKPGLEALSTGLLQLINKGTTARQNIMLLRNAAILGIHLDWNLLWGFPGDKVEFYEETLALMPLLRHLRPPSVFRHISLDRFSPYFERRGDYAIDRVRPWNVYGTIYPGHVPLDKIAYRFIGDYACEAHKHPQLIREIAKEVETWKKNWCNAQLMMIPFDEYYILHDGREPGKPYNHKLDPRWAQEIMVDGRYNGNPYQEWALAEKMAALVDSHYVPLICAKPGVYERLVRETGNGGNDAMHVFAGMPMVQ